MSWLQSIIFLFEPLPDFLNFQVFTIYIQLVQVLAVNAAKDATELVARLRAYHHTAQTKADKKHLSRYSFASYLLRSTDRDMW